MVTVSEKNTYFWLKSKILPILLSSPFLIFMYDCGERYINDNRLCYKLHVQQMYNCGERYITICYVIYYMYNKCTNAGERFFLSRIVLISWNFQHYSIFEYIQVHILHIDIFKHVSIKLTLDIKRKRLSVLFWRDICVQNLSQAGDIKTLNCFFLPQFLLIFNLNEN